MKEFSNPVVSFSPLVVARASFACAVGDYELNCCLYGKGFDNCCSSGANDPTFNET